jgi:hypothetical protein
MTVGRSFLNGVYTFGAVRYAVPTEAVFSYFSWSLGALQMEGRFHHS